MRFSCPWILFTALWTCCVVDLSKGWSAPSPTSCEQVFSLKTDSTHGTQEDDAYFFRLATSFARGYLPDLSNPQEKKFFQYYMSRFLGTPYAERDPEADMKWEEAVTKYSFEALQKEVFPLGQLTRQKHIWHFTPKMETLIQDFTQTMVNLKNPFFAPIENQAEWKKVLEDPEFEFSEKFVTAWKTNKESLRDRFKLLHQMLKSLLAQQTKGGQSTEAVEKALINLFRVWPLTLPRFKLPKLNDPNQDPVLQIQHYLQFRDQIFETETLRTNFDRWADQLISQDHFQYEDAKFRQRFLREIEKSLSLSSYEVQTESLLIRQLSLAEAPERSNLGRCCAGSAYWDLGLHPNYQYFTITDQNFRSDFVITLVLGTAKTNHGEIEKIAFIDKVQNVPIPIVLSFIEGVRQIMNAKGYTLAMSKHLNIHRDDILSNDKELQDFLLEHLSLDKRFSYRNFKQHPSSIEFDQGKSRAKHAGHLQRVLPYILNNSDSFQLLPAPKWKFFKEDFPPIPDLLKKTYLLKKGTAQDKLAYLHIQNTMTKDVDPEFQSQLVTFIHDPNENLDVRRKAFWILSLRQKAAASSADFLNLPTKLQRSILDSLVQSEALLDSFERYSRNELLSTFYDVASKENWKFQKKELQKFFTPELFHQALLNQDIAKMEDLWTEENAKELSINKDQTQTAMIECVEKDLFLSANFLLEKKVDPLQTRRYMDKKNALTRAAFLKKGKWILFFQDHGVSVSSKDGNNDDLWTSFLKGRPTIEEVIEFKKVLPWKDHLLKESPQIKKTLETLGPEITNAVRS